MATKKAAVPTDEKFQDMDFPLFPALDALDKKDYGFYDRLTQEQQKKFSAYMMTHWMSAVDSRNSELQDYYVRATDNAANKHLLNEYVNKHPKLQWLMLCAASPAFGKQFHKWIPHISEGVSKLRDPAKVKDIKEYYTKIYPGTSPSDIDTVAKVFVEENKKKHYLAKVYPSLKHSDIEMLSQLITEADISQYERDRGN